jgi:hypothetical protein
VNIFPIKKRTQTNGPSEGKDFAQTIEMALK